MRAMLEMDEHHWWYRGRRSVIAAELSRLPLPRPADVLDAGCGSGRTLEDLRHLGTATGIELDPDAAELARSRGCGEVVQGRLEALPWPAERFHLITCLDVIEHTPDDRVTLAELRRVTRPGGWLLLTVPAYPALWSFHDVANHHHRRYTRRMLREAAAESGWQVARMSAFNSLLLPAAAAVRLAQRRRTELQDGYTPDLALGPAWLNAVLELPLRAEAGWLARGGTLPAGLSLLALLRRPWALRDR